MLPVIEQKLLSYLHEHTLLYIKHWQHLYAQLYTRDSRKMQEIIDIWLRAAGMSAHPLPANGVHLYMSSTAVAAQTLLIYLPLPDSPSLSLSLAAGISHVLVAYQALHDAYLNIAGCGAFRLKLLLAEQSLPEVVDVRDRVARYRELLAGDACICYLTQPAPLGIARSPLLALGTKGKLSVELAIGGSDIPLEAQYGAFISNAAWQLLWALNAVKDQREDILIAGFYDAVWSVEDGVMDALARLAADAPASLQGWNSQQSLSGLQGVQQYYAYFLTPTCTVHSLYSDQAAASSRAVIPQQAGAQLDFQLVPEQDPLDIYTKLQRYLRDAGHTSVQTRLRSALIPGYTPLANPFVQSVVRATTLAYSRAPHLLPLVSTDDVFLHALQLHLELPTVYILSSPLITDIEEVQHAHYQERIIQAIKQAVLIMADSTLASETAE